VQVGRNDVCPCVEVARSIKSAMGVNIVTASQGV